MVNALLALADGSLFRGRSIGIAGESVGELVFNTAMTGYQEILTDPSYHQQIVTLTYPHIGNVGVNVDDQESDQVYANGLVIRNNSMISSNWRATQSLEDYLIAHKVVAIADVDTRQITHHIREHGALGACIVAGEQIDETQAVDKARTFAGLLGQDLAIKVTTKKPYVWMPPEHQVYGALEAVAAQKLVVVYDFGVKQNILNLLHQQGCTLKVVPADTPVDQVLAEKPDGVFLSNGPGDPSACSYAITAIQTLLEHNVALFGICLGYQLLALAGGAKTIKMKFGHHGANHPVMDISSKKVLITSQNHSFTVDGKTLKNDLKSTHYSLFDRSLQGVCHQSKPAFGFQGHPEASPGPHDINHLFTQFMQLMAKHSHA